MDGGARGCARLLTAPLAGNAYYLLARRKDGTVVAGGAEKFCISPTAFDVHERGNCATRRLGEAGFVRTQTGGLTRLYGADRRQGPDRAVSGRAEEIELSPSTLHGRA